MTLPNIAELEFDDSDVQLVVDTEAIHKTFDWDFVTGEFKLVDGKLVELTGIEYLKVWVQKALHTIKNSLIYAKTGYGSDHHTLIGKNLDISFSRAEYERMIRECLLENKAITSVSNFRFEQDGAQLTITFAANSIYGTTEVTV